jgi:signal transduction histidine kinase/DNA-binding response OmpR family regulator/ligand-binding sensor domain-containing protein
VSIDPDLLDVENTVKVPFSEKTLRENGYASRLFTDRKGGVWIYCYDNLVLYDAELMTFDTHRGEFFAQQKIWIHIMQEDANGNLWVGTDNHGIYLLNRRDTDVKNLMPNEENDRSILFPTILTLYYDDTNTMWVGQYKKGAAWYNQSIYKFTLNKMGDVNIVAAGNDGQLWMGLSGKGIMEWDLKTDAQRLIHYPKYEGDNILVSLIQAKDGTVWAGTYRDGLIRVRSNGEVKAYHANSPGSTVADDNIWALAEDAEGHIWIATLSKGLQCYDPKTEQFTTYTRENARLTDNHLASLCLGPDNTLVVGSASQGIDLFSLNTHTAKPITELSQYHTNHVCVDHRGILWVGAREGLIAYDLRDKRILALDNPINSPVAAIVEDDEQNLWVTIGTRIVRLRVQHDDNNGYAFVSEMYDRSDGLQYSDFNLRSICKMPDGTIVAGGTLGLNLFNPKDMQFNNRTPKVMFTGLTLFNEPVEEAREFHGTVVLPQSIATAQEVNLGYNQNVFSVTFGTDNYILPEKTVFTYKLEGFSSEWLTLAPGVNSVTFTNLAPGRYVLRVRAKNNDGFASKEEATLTIVVRPPFWRTVWAYILYGVLAVGILLFFHLSSIRRERQKYRLQQMQREAEKNEELNNSKMRFFSNISSELRTPISLIIAPLTTLIHDAKDETLRKRLQGVYLHAQVLLNTINQLLDFRSIEEKHHLTLSEGDIVDFVRGVCNDFILMADEKNIQFSFFAESESILMAFDADKVQKIVTNLLSNAFKYTPNKGKVNVQIGHLGDDRNMIEIKVADTGIGISDEDKQHIFDRFYQKKDADDEAGIGIGLTLAYEYATLHGGTINVFDNIGHGSVFVVLIPKRQNAALQQIVDTARQEERHIQGKDEPAPKPEDPEAKALRALSEEECRENARIEAKMLLEEEQQKEEEASADSLEGDAAAEEDDSAEGSASEKDDGEEKTVVVGALNRVAPAVSVRLDRSKIRKTVNNPQVLVVDDNNDFLTFMKYNLAKSYRVTTATDGREAWDTLKTYVPDLIILDVMMPDINGHELCRMIRRDSHLSHIPVLMLTARHTEDSKLEGLQVGADDYMTKPFNPRILSLRMQRLVELGRQRLNSRGQQNLTPTDIPITSVDERLLKDAREYVEAHIAESELSVEELSRQLGMSRVNLYKRMVQLSGKTPIEFIRIIRLRRAAQLLRESQMHVSEIAFEVGFNNPKYFAKYFKEEFGMLPSAYQETHAIQK